MLNFVTIYCSHNLWSSHRFIINMSLTRSTTVDLMFERCYFYCLVLHYLHIISQAIIRPDSSETNSSHNFSETSEIINVTPVQMPRSIPVHLSFIFIAPVRLIIVTLCIANQCDFLWPESCRFLTQNFRTGSFILSTRIIGSFLTCVYRVMDAHLTFGEHERSGRVYSRGVA